MGKWIKKLGGVPLTKVAKVIDSLVTSTNIHTNAPSINAINNALGEVWETVYPVGSIYMNVNNVDPSVIFGGTWEQIKDKFLLACGDTYNNGATGGVASNPYTPAGTVGNHTLTVNEIPQHTHNYHFEDTPTTTQSGLAYAAAGQSAVVWSEEQTSAVGGGQAHNHGFSGTATTFDNMPPYLAVNVWVRTA